MLFIYFFNFISSYTYRASSRRRQSWLSTTLTSSQQGLIPSSQFSDILLHKLVKQVFSFNNPMNVKFSKPLFIIIWLRYFNSFILILNTIALAFALVENSHGFPVSLAHGNLGTLSGELQSIDYFKENGKPCHMFDSNGQDVSSVAMRKNRFNRSYLLKMAELAQ